MTSYTYGPDGLRTSKASGNTVTTYAWDGGNIVNEFISVTENSATTTTENRYLYGIGRIKAYLGTTEVYYLYNAHGDVMGLLNTSCVLTKEYDYDAFGIEVDPSETDANPFRYCGEYYDKETETYYLRARYYKPSTGRFTQQDPANDGLNWYVYCNNNPVTFVDPWGLFTQEQYDYYQLNWSSWYIDSILDAYMNDVNNMGRGTDEDWFAAAWDTWMYNNFSEASVVKKTFWNWFREIFGAGTSIVTEEEFALQQQNHGGGAQWHGSMGQPHLYINK